MEECASSKSSERLDAKRVLMNVVHIQHLSFLSFWTTLNHLTDFYLGSNGRNIRKMVRTLELAMTVQCWGCFRFHVGVHYLTFTFNISLSYLNFGILCEALIAYENVCHLYGDFCYLIGRLLFGLPHFAWLSTRLLLSPRSLVYV